MSTVGWTNSYSIVCLYYTILVKKTYILPNTYNDQSNKFTIILYVQKI